jgi:hypothetical protein
MTVLSANGPQSLSIPVVQKYQKMMIKEVEIDYKTNAAASLAYYGDGIQ